MNNRFGGSTQGSSGAASPGMANWQRAVTSAPPHQFLQVAQQVISQMAPNQYQDHVQSGSIGNLSQRQQTFRVRTLRPPL